MFINDNTFYIGVNDHEVDLFEGQYKVDKGMSYNSYVINDEKIAVLDTVDKHFSSQWLENLDAVLAGRKPDFLIVQHMEPDHSACIDDFLQKYPDAVVVGNQKTFAMLDRFFAPDICKNTLVVKDGEVLDLGTHKLTFIFAPMVHWPEVMLTFDSVSNTLFSADAFGKFGALDVPDNDWACEARRYYFGIVGKYGIPVQTLLKKASALKIDTICPLHGPILKENLSYYISLYNTWSSYAPETDGVFIAYTSIYGNTKNAALMLRDVLAEKGCRVVISDLARCDMAEAVEDAFRYSKLVLASPTYNGSIFPFMRTFIDALCERNYQNRTVAFIENGSWAPVAKKVMHEMLEKSKNITFCENSVTVNSALDGKAMQQIEEMAQELCK